MGLLDGLLGLIPGAGLVQGLLGIGGDLLGQSSAQGYNTQMSSTAYQRASMDMTKAGLNPAMMFGGGSAASSPTMTAPQFGSNAVSNINNTVGTATALKTASATIDNLIAQNAKIKAETLTAGVDAQLRGAQVKNVQQDSFNKGQIGLKLQNEGVTAANEMAIQPEVRKLLDMGGYGGRQVDDILSPVGTVVNSAKNVVGMGLTKSLTRAANKKAKFYDFGDDGQTMAVPIP